MKKFLLTILLLIGAALAYLAYAHFSGGSVNTWGLELGGEKAQVRSQVMRFFENFKFKNIRALPALVDPNTALEQIENFLSETFEVSPNNLDLHSITIENIELDSLEERARVRVHLKGQDLAHQKAFDISKIIFLYRAGPKNWLIDIKNLAS